LVAGLSSYSVNSVGIELTDVPMRYRLAGAPSEQLVPAFRSGARIEIPAETFQAVTGRAYLAREGSRITADYAAIEIEGPDDPVRSVVGRRGEFYLENLSPGPHRVRFTLRGETCETTLDVPESTEMFLDLGEVTCETR
jgi:outer membrane usher protein